MNFPVTSFTRVPCFFIWSLSVSGTSTLEGGSGQEGANPFTQASSWQPVVEIHFSLTWLNYTPSSDLRLQIILFLYFVSRIGDVVLWQSVSRPGYEDQLQHGSKYERCSRGFVCPGFIASGLALDGTDFYQPTNVNVNFSLFCGMSP